MSGMWVCPKGLDPNDPENWEKLEGVEPTGYSVGPVSVGEGSDWDTPVKVEPVYRRMTAEWVESALEMKLAPWQRNILGQWQETPREELKRRLNLWLRGTYPGEPINWKGIS